MKKGFTLVELLAVIVILAIILIIAVPNAISLIRNAKISVIDSSVRLVISQIEFKRNVDKTYDVSTINASNTYEELGIKNDVFSEIVATIENENTDNELIRISVVCKDKYSGFAATGTKNEVNVYSVDAVAPTVTEVAIDLSSSVTSDSVIAGSTITIEWPEASGDADSYNLESKYDSNEWESVAVNIEEPSYEYSIPSNGASTVQFRVNAENNVGTSDWVYTDIIDVSGWNLITIIESGTSFNDIYYYNGRWIAVGDYGYIATSINGTTWSYQKNGTDKLTFIYNFNGIWVTGGQNGKILISSNGTNWTAKTITGTQTYMAIKEYNGKAIIMGTTGKGAMSIDGTNWTSVTDSSGAYFQDIDYFNGKWIAVAQNGKISTSTNGTTWISQTVGTASYYDIYIINNKAFVVGSAGTILTSNDGTTWNSQTVGTRNLTGIYYYDGMYVVVGLMGEVYSSNDGINWTIRTTNTTSSLRSVYNNNGLWMITGSSSNVLLSNDAINWQLFVLQPSVSLNIVNYNNNMWYFAGGGVVGTFSG